MQVIEQTKSEARVLGDSGVTYKIDVDGNGSVRCSCPSFKFGKVNWCKHLAFVYDQNKGATQS